MANKTPLRTENRLLAALPAAEYKRLRKKFEPVRLIRKRILYECGQSIRSCYFFQNGMASVFAIGEDGRMVQIAIVDRNGFVGVPIVLMGSKSTVRIVTQTPVQAFKMDAKELLVQLNREGKLREVLLRYTQALQAQVAQSALCNPLHSIRQRLCRWLLMYRDSSQSDSFDLTQEEIASMLGAHRNQIGMEARQLSKRGLIQFRRGTVSLLDQVGLEQESCECYRAIRHWTDELSEI